MPTIAPHTVLVAWPLPSGGQTLVPTLARLRTCHRLDGRAKIGYDSRKEAKRGLPKHQETYRCPNCACWHRATVRSKQRRAPDILICPEGRSAA